MSDVENKETFVSGKDPDKDVVHPPSSATDCQPPRNNTDSSGRVLEVVRKSSDPNWEDGVALAGQTRQVTQRITSEEELAIAKATREVYKEQIYATARNSDEAPISLVVKICWVLAALAVVCLVGFVCYSLLQTQTHDTTLEDRIMSGNKAESLRALKQQSIQNYFTIFVIVIVLLVLVMSAGFGYLIYFKDTEKHETHKRWDVVHSAEQAVDYNEKVISQLTTDLNVQISQISSLKSDVNKYSAKIDELSQNNEENQEEIKDLMRKKGEKEAQLASAQASLKAKEESLAEAKTREEGLNECLKKKEETNKKLVEEASVTTTRISRLQDDLSQEKSEASSLRSRARCLESSQEQYRSRMQQLQVDKARLTAEVQSKPTVIIERRWWWW